LEKQRNCPWQYSHSGQGCGRRWVWLQVDSERQGYINVCNMTHPKKHLLVASPWPGT
jgi:hypothetical protein